MILKPMKTKTFGLFAIPVIAAIMIGSAVAPALAGGPVNNAALVIETDPAFCTLLDGNGNFDTILGTIHSVVNNAGNAKLTCKGITTPAADGNAAKFTFDDISVLCGTGLGSTDNWKNTVSAEGDVTLTCFVKANQP